MAAIKDIYVYLDGLAPFSYQKSFDNAGFLVGHGERQATKILVALDITLEVIEEAAELGAELIVSHHPVIFHPARSVTDQNTTGLKVLALVEHGIAAICAHTNLDVVKGGVNDALARALNLTNIVQLCQDGVDFKGEPYGIGRIGLLEQEQNLLSFVAFVKERLRSNGLRYVDSGRPVRKVAVGGGACSDLMGNAVALGCDTFVTADVKYDGFLDAKALNLNLIDAGHFPTENVVCPVLADWLKKGFPELEILQSESHREVFSYL